MKRMAKMAALPIMMLAMPSSGIAGPPPNPATPAPKAERKLTPAVWIYRANRFDHPQERTDLIREIWSMNNLDSIPEAEYPADAVAAQRKAEATVKISVAPDDSIAACTLLSSKDDVELAARSCGLIRKYGSFKHAVDKQGKATLAEIIMVVDWDLRDLNMLAPPAPSAPSRWLKRGRYERDSWPPLDTHQVSYVVNPPNLNYLKVKQKGLPKNASTGLQITLNESYQGAECVVRESSGVPALDKAACDAMMSATFASTYYSAKYPPIVSVLVNWDRGLGSWRTPSRKQTYPELIAPGTISTKDLPPGDGIAQRPVKMNVELDANGRPQSCIVNTTSGNDAIDARSCAIVAERSRFTGARDLFGRPYPGGMYMVVDWKAFTISNPRDYTYR